MASAFECTSYQKDPDEDVADAIQLGALKNWRSGWMVAVTYFNGFRSINVKMSYKRIN